MKPMRQGSTLGSRVCQGCARPRHPARTATGPASDDVPPLGASIARPYGRNSHSKGSLPRQLPSLTQGTGADGVTLRGATSSASATCRIKRSRSSAIPSTSQTTCSMGSRGGRAAGLQRLLAAGCFEPRPTAQASRIDGSRTGALAAAFVHQPYRSRSGAICTACTVQTAKAPKGLCLTERHCPSGPFFVRMRSRFGATRQTHAPIQGCSG